MAHADGRLRLPGRLDDHVDGLRHARSGTRLAPGQEWRTVWDSALDRAEPGAAIGSRFTGTVSYGPNGRSRTWSCCAGCSPNFQDAANETRPEVLRGEVGRINRAARAAKDRLVATPSRSGTEAAHH